MMALKTLARKLLMFPLAMENWIVIIAGIAGAISWSFGELMLGGPSESLESFLVSFIHFFRLVTITFLIFGGLAWFISWTKTRILSLPVGVEAKNYQPWFYLVIVILLVEGALAAVIVHPLSLLVQENIGLLQSWGAWEGLRRGGEFSVIYFVPVFGILLAPALGVMTAVAFICGAAASLGYLLMGLEGSPRVLLRSICLQVALLLGLFFALDLFEVAIRIVTTDITRPEAAQPKAEILSWLTAQRAVFALMARRFAWLLSGFFISGVLVLWKAHEQQLKGKQVLGHFPEEMPTNRRKIICGRIAPRRNSIQFCGNGPTISTRLLLDKISFSFQPPLQGLWYIRLRLQHVDLCCTDEQPQSSRKGHHSLRS